MTVPRQRLAIIGCGSSGLITLKKALDKLSDWEIVCFEKSTRITGCWGNPYPGFVSTSTKYTTQFACFPKFEAEVDSAGGRSRNEFFRDGEYGQYLKEFAEHFSLTPHITLKCQVERLARTDDSDWELTISRQAGTEAKTSTERFDCVVVCTGLAAEPKEISETSAQLTVAELNDPQGLSHLRDKRIVVVGGGESAVDYAHRLAQDELNNEVFLSLQSGVRVSPRYHPIRGVPSDFLRNRLMLSIHPDLRNWLGQRFVEARILYQETFERLFPNRNLSRNENQANGEHANGDPRRESRQLSKQWAHKLTKAAKDDLFNMFHNKSDDFLSAVGTGRIKIVGPPVDADFAVATEFGGEETVDIAPDMIVPAVGYRSQLEELTAGLIKLSDFYLGCTHTKYDNLHLVGFARPIIGNVPTISEVQAELVSGLIAGEYQRESTITQLNQVDAKERRRRYQQLNLDAVYPVEMFPYCDRLAKQMQIFPSLWKLKSLVKWIRLQLAPASTLHYQYQDSMARKYYEPAAIFMPSVLILLLLMLKPLSWIYAGCNAAIRTMCR